MSKSSIIATMALVAGLVGATAGAQAKGGHGGHHGHHHGHHGYGLVYAAPVYVAPAYSDCGYAYARWQSTGSFGWKKRYYACKGWW